MIGNNTLNAQSRLHPNRQNGKLHYHSRNPIDSLMKIAHRDAWDLNLHHNLQSSARLRPLKFFELVNMTLSRLFLIPKCLGG